MWPDCVETILQAALWLGLAVGSVFLGEVAVGVVAERPAFPVPLLVHVFSWHRLCLTWDDRVSLQPKYRLGFCPFNLDQTLIEK